MPDRAVTGQGPRDATLVWVGAWRQARYGVRHNHTKNLPSHLATILLLDPETGALLAMMDGRYITEARTAAVSAVSTRFLGRADASTLAIIGSGVQARSHLEAYQLVREIKEVRIWSPRAQSRQQFVDDMSPKAGIPIIAADSARPRCVRRHDRPGDVSPSRE